MLYLGIDQHKRQLTVNLRNEDGSVILPAERGQAYALYYSACNRPGKKR